MALAPKQMIVGSMIAAGVVSLACLADIFFGFPFSGQTVMDIMFLLSAGMVFYLGFDSMKEQM
ncbi:MAG: hypothetical protein ACKVT0_23495 [Planctomycetaceae bacterium]